jgi:hypothetical protein
VRTLEEEVVTYSMVTTCSQSTDFVPNKYLPAYEPPAVDSSAADEASERLSLNIGFRLQASSSHGFAFLDARCTSTPLSRFAL